jgi:hypothetical protein
MRRDVGYVVDVGPPAFVQAPEDAVMATMIEKASAVDGHGAVRPMSIGIPGQWDHPKVKEAAPRHGGDLSMAREASIFLNR